MTPRHRTRTIVVPFETQETNGTITCDGVTVVPTLGAKIEKGFFFSSDQAWTCYRRNYIAVSASFGLQPWISDACLYLDQCNGKQPEQIQSMAVSLAAAVDGVTGKTIELIQHTPKRDKGPQLSMKKELLAPTPPRKSYDHDSYSPNSFHQSSSEPGPQLPLQNESDSSQQYPTTSHTSSNSQHCFERIMFKSATANNGKRRGQQQRYRLIVSLWANIQNPRDKTPKWVKIAACSSQPVVVRGRSISFFPEHEPQNAGAGRGAGGPGLGGPRPNGLDSNDTRAFGSYSNGMSNGSATMSGNLSKETTYSHPLDLSLVHSHPVSSRGSMDGHSGWGHFNDQHMLYTSTIGDNTSPSYNYCPALACRSNPEELKYRHTLPSRIIEEESPSFAALAASCQCHSCVSYQGVEDNRGYSPGVQALVGY